MGCRDLGPAQLPMDSDLQKSGKCYVLVQRELDKSVSQLRDFFCLWQIVNPPLAGLSY